MIIPVILSGGSGTRLWPVSRKLFPKQLIPMTGEKLSLLQTTVLRVSDIPNAESPVIVCNEEHRFMVASQLQEISCTPQSIILEPVGKNTAPAACAAAASVKGDPILLILPADHHIVDTPAFAEAVEAGVSLAEQGRLVTFGIVPTKPETGYGYIKCGNTINEKALKLERFTEKPNQEEAQSFLEEGGYLWNSGMFLFKASTYLSELEKFEPEMSSACQLALEKGTQDLDFIRLNEAIFKGCRSNSIDYSVMEHTEQGAVVPLSCGWNDVGSWAALHEVCEKDSNGNVLSGDVVTEDVHNSYLHSSDRLIAGLGLNNIAVVETKDAVLVAPLDQVQNVKLVVSKLKQENREVISSHCRVYRPWGNYEGIDLGERYQVKRITVYPGQKLSVQKHYHRAEHWIVVKGTARVILQNDEILLSEDQSTYIPLGTVHSLENPGKVNLELIEVQTGSYLGEDDIERISDIYGRID